VKGAEGIEGALVERLGRRVVGDHQDGFRAPPPQGPEQAKDLVRGAVGLDQVGDAHGRDSGTEPGPQDSGRG
jgi:hypothetical protein